jgi:hypothetical protein
LRHAAPTFFDRFEYYKYAAPTVARYRTAAGARRGVAVVSGPTGNIYEKLSESGSSDALVAYKTVRPNALTAIRPSL